MTALKLKTLSLAGLVLLSLSARFGFAASQESLAQALSDRAATDGFALSGIDQVGGETTGVSDADHSLTALRKLLSGYSYILELDPNVHSDMAARKPVRLRILGRAGENQGDGAAPAQFAAASNPGDAGAVMSNAGQTSGEQAHPIARMLQAAAAATIRQAGGASSQTPGGMGAISQSAESQNANASTGDPAHNAADMAALTQAASANVSALVAGLKAACPAGSKC